MNPTASTILTIDVVIEDSDPTIWRKLAVPACATLCDLHEIIQAAFGWKDNRQHHFMHGPMGKQTLFVNPATYDESDPAHRDTRKTLVGDLLAKMGDELDYEYDLNDNWVHLIDVVGISVEEKSPGIARCLDGANAAPPEECGGILAYYEILDCLSHPKNEGYDHWSKHLGNINPSAFDLNAINLALAKIKL